MRVLHVITDTDRRGAQVFATDLASAMSRAGHENEALALIQGQQRPALDVPVLGPRFRSPSTLLALRRRMREVDVTVAHGSATGLACALAGFPSIPFVYRQISDTRFWASTRFRRWRVARYLRRARRIVALSEGAKSDLMDHLGLPASLITVVPNGVPVGSFRPAEPGERKAARTELGLAEDGFVAMYIGALVPEKGADVAIDAVARLDDVHLLMVGGGPERQALEERADQLAPGRITFAGVMTDALPAYRASDVVLLPSKGGDSMPATLIEAGFCGLPSVSTPIGSITDIVLDGETGLIVEPGDVEAMRDAIDRLAKDGALRDDLGESARHHCLGHFEIDVVAEGWLKALYGVRGAPVDA